MSNTTASTRLTVAEIREAISEAENILGKGHELTVMRAARILGLGENSPGEERVLRVYCGVEK